MKITQVRYFAEPAKIKNNLKKNQPLQLKRDELIDGSAFNSFYPIKKIFILAPENTKFYINNNKECFFVGAQGSIEIDNIEINKLLFDQQSLLNIGNDEKQVLILNIYYEKI